MSSFAHVDLLPPRAPRHWAATRARHIFREVVDRDHDGEELLAVTQHHGVVPKNELDFRTVTPGDDVSNFKLVTPGDFVISLRTFQGGIELSETRGIVSPAYTVLRPTRPLHAPFYRHYLKSDYFIGVLQAVCSGIRDGKSVSYDDFAELRLLVPPIPEQRTIADFLDRETAKIDALVEKKQRLVELLEEKRTALITQAVTKGLDPTVPMKDSGIEWLGEIPEHWQCHPVKRFALSMCDGPFGSNMKSSHYSDEGVRLVRLQNIGEGHFDDSDKAYIPEEHFEALPGHDAMPGDLVVAGLGDENHPAGRACVLPETVDRAMVKADCFRLRLNQEELLHSFAMSYLCSRAARAGMAVEMRGATRDRINLSGLSRVPMLVPPLEDQRAIISFIDDRSRGIRDLTGKVREAIDKLREYRTALVSAAVTGKIDVRQEAAS